MFNGNKDLREFGGFVLDAEKRVLWFENEPVSLALKEIELLCALTEKSGEVVAKNELIEKVWADSFVEESNLARHVYVLRKTLKSLGAGADLIQTVPRRGYRFAAPVRVVEDGTPAGEDEAPAGEDEAPRVAFAGGGRLLSPARLRVVVCALTIFFGAVAALAFYGFRYSAGGASGPRVRSLAVLPFRTISPARGHADEGLALADILITRLSVLREIGVRPTSAIAGFADEDALAAGRALQTDAVLEGAIYRTADRVRVTARLVSVADNAALWSGEFEGPAADEIALQSEIALQLTDALALNLSGGEKDALARRYTESVDAQRLYLKGRREWSKRNYPGGKEAERLFRQAIERDPRFALAYSGLADVLSLSNEAAEAEFAIEKALALDPNLAEAHASLGLFRMFQGWRGAAGPDWAGAEAELRRAVELNPNYAPARQWYATLLAIRGAPRRAQAELRRALDIDPLSYNLWSDLAEAHYFAREYREAEECALKALAINPDFAFALGHLRQIYLRTGDYEKYIAYESRLAASLAVVPADRDDVRRDLEARWKARREIVNQEGIEAYVRAHIRPPSTGDASALYGHARSYAFLGEREKALAALESAFEQRAFMMVFVKAEPAFDSLRGEPRFREILRKMDLL